MLLRRSRLLIPRLDGEGDRKSLQAALFVSLGSDRKGRLRLRLTSPVRFLPIPSSGRSDWEARVLGGGAGAPTYRCGFCEMGRKREIGSPERRWGRRLEGSCVLCGAARAKSTQRQRKPTQYSTPAGPGCFEAKAKKKSPHAFQGLSPVWTHVKRASLGLNFRSS